MSRVPASARLTESRDSEGESDPSAVASVREYFRPGVEPGDIPELYALQDGRAAVAALTALFRGSDPEILIRLLVLRELGARPEPPRWSVTDIRAHLAYLDEVKLETVLARLRESALLERGDDGHYAVSKTGRLVLAGLGSMLRYAGDDDGDLGYLTAQIAGGSRLGTVAEEDLRHLLSQLAILQEDFDRAVLSGSENEVRVASANLHRVWRWIERGTEIMREIAASPDLDGPTHRLAQRIGQAQSRLLNMTSVFQRTLNQMERQRVHLGSTGISSSDVGLWLRTVSIDELLQVAASAVRAVAHPLVVETDVVADIAEHVLLTEKDEDDADVPLPPPSEAPLSAEQESEETPPAFERWLKSLREFTDMRRFSEAVPDTDYVTSAYRFSLLGLIGATDAALLPGGLAELASLPLHIDISTQFATVERNGVLDMTEGAIVPAPRSAPK